MISARTGDELLSSVIELTMRNTRRYGGYVVHFGMVLVFIGICGQAFNQDKQMEMRAGLADEHRRIHAELPELRPRTPGPNYDAERVTIEVTKKGKSLMMLYPEKRNLSVEPGIRHDGGDLFHAARRFVRCLRRDESGNGHPVIHAYLNPLVKWIWLGGVVVVLGTILALVPNRQAVMVLRAVAQPARVPIAAGRHMPQIAPASSHHDGSD